jgi:hypothetical protein
MTEIPARDCENATSFTSYRKVPPPANRYDFLSIVLVLPVGRDGKVHGHSGFLCIPSRFLVGRNETSCKITGDRDFALVYYVDWFLLRLRKLVASFKPNCRKCRRGDRMGGVFLL